MLSFLRDFGLLRLVIFAVTLLDVDTLSGIEGAFHRPRILTIDFS